MDIHFSEAKPFNSPSGWVATKVTYRDWGIPHGNPLKQSVVDTEHWDGYCFRPAEEDEDGYLPEWVKVFPSEDEALAVCKEWNEAYDH